MTAIASSPADLLFSNAEGKPTSLEDLIDDALDGAYRDRIPALIGLLHDGAPRDRLYACMVLTARGVADGFTALIGWAEQPGSAPWADQPMEIDRRHGGRRRVRTPRQRTMTRDNDDMSHRFAPCSRGVQGKLSPWSRRLCQPKIPRGRSVRREPNGPRASRRCSIGGPPKTCPMSRSGMSVTFSR